MTIESQLVATSKAIAEMVVANIGNNQDLFDETMELVYKDNGTMAMRAAWVAGHIVNKYPWMAKPHLERMLKLIPNAKTEGVKRIGIGMLEKNISELSEDMFGELADAAFDYVQDPKQPIAVRGISIEILMYVAKKYPEIIPELIEILKAVMPEGSPGIKNKCFRSIEKLNKMNKQ